MMSKCQKLRHLREPKIAKFCGEICNQTPLEACTISATNTPYFSSKMVGISRAGPHSLAPFLPIHLAASLLIIFPSHKNLNYQIYSQSVLNKANCTETTIWYPLYKQT